MKEEKPIRDINRADAMSDESKSSAQLNQSSNSSVQSFGSSFGAIAENTGAASNRKRKLETEAESEGSVSRYKQLANQASKEAKESESELAHGNIHTSSSSSSFTTPQREPELESSNPYQAQLKLQLEPSEKIKKLITQVLQPASQIIAETQKLVVKKATDSYFPTSSNFKEYNQSFNNHVQGGLITNRALYSTALDPNPFYLILPPSSLVPADSTKEYSTGVNKLSPLQPITSETPKIVSEDKETKSSKSEVNTIENELLKARQVAENAERLCQIREEILIKLRKELNVANEKLKNSESNYTRLDSEHQSMRSELLHTQNALSGRTIQLGEANLQLQNARDAVRMLNQVVSVYESEMEQEIESHRQRRVAAEERADISAQQLETLRQEKRQIELQKNKTIIDLSEELLIHKLQQKIQKIKASYGQNIPLEDLGEPIESLCPISLTLMDDPVAIAGSAKIFDRSAIELYLGNPANDTCPLSQVRLMAPEYRALITLPNLKKTINEFIQCKNDFEKNSASIPREKREKEEVEVNLSSSLVSMYGRKKENKEMEKAISQDCSIQYSSSSDSNS